MGARRRKVLERLWVIGTVAYAGLRVILAKATVERYGVNIWVFGAIDVTSSIPYGVGTARLVIAFLDRNMQAAARWGAVSAVCFIAPDLYVMISGHHMPAYLYAIVIGWVTLMSILAVRTVQNRIRQGRAVTAAAEISGSSAP
jgi:hypothetical protein